MTIPKEPFSRKEQYLSKIAGDDHGIPAEPFSREEQYLDAIAKNGGGGGGGSSDLYEISISPTDMDENSVNIPQSAIDYIVANMPPMIRFNIDLTSVGGDGVFKYGEFYRSVNLESEGGLPDITSSVYTLYSLPLLNHEPDRITTQSFVIDSQTTSPVLMIHGSTKRS